MDGSRLAADLLPPDYRQALRETEAEEIRLRIGRAPTVLLDGRERRFHERVCTQGDLLRVLERASGASLHAVAEAMREGYLSYRGVRIGVCGTALARAVGGGFGAFSSLCLRVPREWRGIGRALLPALRENVSGGSLILSAPGGGKTSLLREYIRCLSEGGLRVGVLDERNELSATDENGAGFDLGAHTDTLVGMPKAEGAMLLLRSMNPQLVAMDEITSAEDAEAVLQIAGCGVGILATAHTSGFAQMRSRPLYRRLLESGVFTRAVCISGTGRARQYRLEELRL